MARLCQKGLSSGLARARLLKLWLDPSLAATTLKIPQKEDHQQFSHPNRQFSAHQYFGQQMLLLISAELVVHSGDLSLEK